MTDDSIQVKLVTEGEDLEVLTELLSEFHDWMHDNFSAYDPSEELADDRSGLETETVPSWAWIARHGDEPVGCVLLFGMSRNFAEFRRLWVRPTHRGHGIGRRLVETVVERSAAEGYDRLGLTAPPWGEAAVALYEDLGFEHTPPYPETRLPDEFHEEAIFMQLGVSE